MSIFFPLGGSILLKAIVISPYKEMCIHNNTTTYNSQCSTAPIHCTLDKSPIFTHLLCLYDVSCLFP